MITRFFKRQHIPTLIRIIHSSIITKKEEEEESKQALDKKELFSICIKPNDKPTEKVLKFMFSQHPRCLSVNELYDNFKKLGFPSKRYLKNILRICLEARYIKRMPVRYNNETVHVFGLKKTREGKLARILDLRRPLEEVLYDKTPIT